MSTFKDIINSSKNSYKDDPSSLTFNFDAHGICESGTKCVIQSGGHEIIASEPESFGGQNEGPSPATFILVSLISCRCVTYRFAAAELGVEIGKIEINMKGSLDVAGYLGFNPNSRPGFSDFNAEVKIESNASQDELEKLHKRVDQYCCIQETIANKTPVKFVAK